MSELLHLTGSVAYNLAHSANPAAPKYTGAPTADNVDPNGIVVTSMGRDILGNRVCLFMVSPDRKLLANWNGGENVVVSVREANTFPDIMALPPSLSAAYQPHYGHARLLLSNQVSLLPAGALSVVKDEVFTLSHVRVVHPEGLRSDNTLEAAMRTGVVMAACDRQGHPAFVVVPSMDTKAANRLCADGAVRRVAGMQVVPQTSQMEKIMAAMQGSHRPPQRIIVASDLKLTFGGGVS